LLAIASEAPPVSETPPIPAAPAVPTGPPVPVTPAPAAPTGAVHLAGSSGSSSDPSRKLQLLVYAVGATIAALGLARGRFVLAARVHPFRFAFLPVIERPG